MRVTQPSREEVGGGVEVTLGRVHTQKKSEDGADLPGPAASSSSAPQASLPSLPGAHCPEASCALCTPAVGTRMSRVSPASVLPHGGSGSRVVSSGLEQELQGETDGLEFCPAVR